MSTRSLENQALSRIMNQSLKERLATTTLLSDVQWYIIAYRLGWITGYSLTFEEIAHQLGYSDRRGPFDSYTEALQKLEGDPILQDIYNSWGEAETNPENHC